MTHEIQAQPARVAGEAQRIPAAAKQALEAQPAVLRATIHITRAATGLTETYEIVGTPMQPQEAE